MCIGCFNNIPLLNIFKYFLIYWIKCAFPKLPTSIQINRLLAKVGYFSRNLLPLGTIKQKLSTLRRNDRITEHPTNSIRIQQQVNLFIYKFQLNLLIIWQIYYWIFGTGIRYMIKDSIISNISFTFIKIKLIITQYRKPVKLNMYIVQYNNWYMRTFT